MRARFLIIAFLIFEIQAFATASEQLKPQHIVSLMQTLGLDGQLSNEEVVQTANEVFAARQTLSCRSDGFSCKSSIECCSTCFRGSCGGNTHNKPEGASCSSSIECNSYCFQGVCGGNTHDKPDGAECSSFIECHTYCFQNRCGGI